MRRPLVALAALATLAVARPAAALDWRQLGFGQGAELKLLGQPLRIDITESLYGVYHGDLGYLTVETNIHGGPQPENLFAAVTSRLNIDATWKRWRLAARFDTAVYFATSPTVNGRAADWYGDPKTVTVTELSRFCDVPQSVGWPAETFFWPEKIALEYSGRSVEIKLGDFYISIGRGLVLSLRKLDELGIDTTLQGGRFVLHEGELGATLAVGATNIQNVDEATGRFAPDPFDLIAAGRVEYRFFDKVLIGLHQVGGVLNHDALDRPHVHRDGMLMYGGSLDAPRLLSWLALYLEGAGQLAQANDARSTGYALYGTVTGYFGPVSLLVEAKHYVNFQRWRPSIPSSFPEFLPVNYNNPPTAERIDTELVAPVYNVSGPRLRVDYRASAWLLVYGSYGYFEDRGITPDGKLTRVYHDPYAGGELRSQGRSHLFPSGGYRVELCDAHDTAPCNGREFQHVGHVEWDFAQALPHRMSIESQGRALFRQGDLVTGTDANGNTTFPTWLEGEAYLALKWTPRLVATMGLEWSNKPTRSAANELFVNGSVQWNFTTASSLRFWAGGTRGGLKCISGVCRDFPPFTGARLELVIRL